MLQLRGRWSKGADQQVEEPRHPGSSGAMPPRALRSPEIWSCVETMEASVTEGILRRLCGRIEERQSVKTPEGNEPQH